MTTSTRPAALPRHDTTVEPDAGRLPQGARGAARRRLPRGWPRLVSPLAILVLWQFASTTRVLPADKLPSPTTIARAAVSLVRTDSPAYGTLQGALLVSLQRAALGFAIGATAGVLLALVAGLSRLGEHAVDPVMQMLRTLPLFGLIPVLIVWFGIGEIPKVALVALGAMFPLYLNTYAGIRGVDAKLADLGQVLALRRGELVRHIVLPGALPQALVGMRQSLGVAWIALVVAEQINADAGLGFMISQAQQFLQFDVIVVALLVYCVLGLLTDAVVRLLERRALAWRRGFLE
ncbi:MAG: sulfonate transport system permease protein [Micromonosporaceae bacterium]